MSDRRDGRRQTRIDQAAFVQLWKAAEVRYDLTRDRYLNKTEESRESQIKLWVMAMLVYQSGPEITYRSPLNRDMVMEAVRRVDNFLGPLEARQREIKREYNSLKQQRQDFQDRTYRVEQQIDHLLSKESWCWVEVHYGPHSPTLHDELESLRRQVVGLEREALELLARKNECTYRLEDLENEYHKIDHAKSTLLRNRRR